MMKSRLGALMASVSLSLMATAAAHAADKADKNAEAAKAKDTRPFEEIVVTAVPRAASTLMSSVSVSSVSPDEIQKFAPRSAAEIFRNIPGVRSESTGGEGNANIAVRGLPVASGGAKFLQLQEDGLPVMEFGDIAFGNADIFLRADYSIARIEAVRGGSASTLASNSPGGVINFISNTGKEEGGAVALTRGVDYNTTRADFAYGGPIGDGLRFHVAGFYRVGEGPRHAGYDGNKGGQIKANITKEFDKGFVRLYFKHLDDRSIGYLPMPVKVSGTNANPQISSITNFNISSDTPHSVYFLSNLGIGGDGNRRVSNVADGMHPLSTAVGGEFNFDLSDSWNVSDKIRVAKTSGRFVSPFPAEVGSASSLAEEIGGTGATLAYANGPNGGDAITNPGALNGNGLAMRVHLFDVELNDLSNFANDFKLTKSVKLDSGNTVDFTAGYYKSAQTINMDWVWNSYLMEVKGNNAALLNVYDANGNAMSDSGLLAYGVPYWGNCCQRNYDTQYDIDAPYASVGVDMGNLTIDASLRYDSGRATGSYAGGVQSPNLDVNQDGTISVPEQSVSVIDRSNPMPVNYTWHYWSYSVGANYAFNDDLATFARISRGGRANADRLLFGKVKADGSVAKEDAIDMVNQIELGVKYRTGNFGIFATGFYAKTQEQNFEATTQKFFDRTYKAEGVEIEAQYHYDAFDFNGGITYTDAEISSDALNPSVVGNRPRRQAKFVYQATASYTLDRFQIGTNVIGTTSSYTQDTNQLVMPGYAQVNAFASYEIADGLSLMLNVNNLFDVVGLTESEEASIIDGQDNIIRARSINGRSTTATLKYTF
ncbi:TonB-dependent receptor [Kordiimonas marina]|uniref:TonB-dependent receptor n=1 Tax=Kordiimonas marina TaxID=2872312 RepID=UPI001FF3472B|nr:TonB-dependent receptor [Kordiimonas marina]MCJ9430656.1 TonB-dependent receptor [Kordiimonas marina]